MTSTDDAPRRDRLRGFRIATYAVYLLVVSVFSVLVIISVVRSVLAMTPPRPPPSAPPDSVASCVSRAEALFLDLDTQRRNLSSHDPVTDADGTWREFRVAWLKRHGEAAARCDIEAKSRKLLRDVYRRLEKTMDLYTTQSVQFAGEVGPTIDAFRRAAARARTLAQATDSAAPP